MRYEIEGGSLPIVTLYLDPGDKIQSEVGGRIWQRGNIRTETSSGGGVFKALGRMVSGESLFLSFYYADGPGELAFASSFPGCIIARHLAPGESIICEKKSFLCAEASVTLAAYVNKNLKGGIFSGEGFIMQKITGPGVAFLEVNGYAKQVELAPGERIICDTSALAAYDESCTMEIVQVKGLKNKMLGGEGWFDTCMIGPGRVYLQSMTIKNIADLLVDFLPFKK